MPEGGREKVMAITKQDKQDLDHCYAEWSKTFKGCKEDYFSVMYLMKKFRRMRSLDSVGPRPVDTPTFVPVPAIEWAH